MKWKENGKILDEFLLLIIKSDDYKKISLEITSFYLINLPGFISYFCFILLFTIHIHCLCSTVLTAFKVENEFNSCTYTLTYTQTVFILPPVINLYINILSWCYRSVG